MVSFTSIQDAFLRVFPEDGFIFLPVWEKSGQEWPTSYSETSRLVEFLSFPPPKQLRNKVMGRGRWLSQRNLSAPPTSRESTKLDGNQEKKEEGKQNKHLTLSANNDIDVFIPNENHKHSQEDIRGGKLAHPRTDSSLVSSSLHLFPHMANVGLGHIPNEQDTMDPRMAEAGPGP